jgi:hypothetical protein
VKYKQLILIEMLVEHIEKNETPTPELVKAAREIVDHEKVMLQERSDRSKTNLDRARVKYMP